MKVKGNDMTTTHYGFKTANRGEQSAWFHSAEAAARFNAACGGELGEIETTTEAEPADIMDTPEKPWTVS